ncbi:unnamed protein product [Adineta steineri]|uniref:Uncharacterized protein n=1 Tax=Adineta steineri TaxID=433720 RepID=A0A815ETL4_9BILA|nr:unnamed protein product [Adineta steineri]
MPFHMVIIQSSGKYYLAVLQQSLYTNISTSIRPSQESCFFGDECQFYTKGLDPTLDEILDYELKRNTILSKQFIKVSLIVFYQ